jgi:hypothetical protein
VPRAVSEGDGVAPGTPVNPAAPLPGKGGVSIASSMRETSRICRARVARSAAVSRGSAHATSSARVTVRLAMRRDVARAPRRAGGGAINDVPYNAQRVPCEIDIADLRRDLLAYRWNNSEKSCELRRVGTLAGHPHLA